MKENKLLLSKFISEKGFELNNYLTQLFDAVKVDSRDGSTGFFQARKEPREPAPRFL